MNLTSLEPEKEEYVLTQDEERQAVQSALLAVQRHMIWKMKGMGFLDPQILIKIKETNFDELIDRDNVLKKANSNKLQDLWHQEQRRNEKQKEKDDYKKLCETYTAKNMFSLMKWTSRNDYGKELLVTSDNKKMITTICYFLSNDGRFETELGYSFAKGLLIRGVSGLGKTFVVKCVEKNELNPIRILSMIEIAEQVKLEGEYYIWLKENKILYLDDVGTEEATVNHYGTKINFFKNFIESYYLRNKVFNKLIISTNNNFSEIEEKYGFRVRSRIKDMFNIIDVSGKDMRGFSGPCTH